MGSVLMGSVDFASLPPPSGAPQGPRNIGRSELRRVVSYTEGGRSVLRRAVGHTEVGWSALQRAHGVSDNKKNTAGFRAFKRTPPAWRRCPPAAADRANLPPIYRMRPQGGAQWAPWAFPVGPMGPPRG